MIYNINMARNKTEIYDFTFNFVYSGHYVVKYTSPNTNKKYCKLITDMTLIDKTYNADSPKRCDLNHLKYIVKTFGTKIN